MRRRDFWNPAGALVVGELHESLLLNRSGIRLWEWPGFSKKLPAGVIEDRWLQDRRLPELPALPAMGDLDLEQVKSSEYFFA